MVTSRKPESVVDISLRLPEATRTSYGDFEADYGHEASKEVSPEATRTSYGDFEPDYFQQASRSTHPKPLAHPMVTSRLTEPRLPISPSSRSHSHILW